MGLKLASELGGVLSLAAGHDPKRHAHPTLSRRESCWLDTTPDCAWSGRSLTERAFRAFREDDHQ